MSQQLAVSLLRQGSNGNEILNILDVIVNEVTEENINDVAAHWATLQGADTAALTF